MRPNGETSRGLFNGNEYTMWAQGGVRGRAGSRDQTGEEGQITTVCGEEEEGVMFTVCVCVWGRVQEGWQNNRNTLQRVSLKWFRSHFKFQPVSVLGIVITGHGLTQLSSKGVKFLFLLLDTVKEQPLSPMPRFFFFLVEPAVTTWQSCNNNQLTEKRYSNQSAKIDQAFFKLVRWFKFGFYPHVLWFCFLSLCFFPSMLIALRVESVFYSSSIPVVFKSVCMKLQKCFEDDQLSISMWVSRYSDWIAIIGWTVPLRSLA